MRSKHPSRRRQIHRQHIKAWRCAELVIPNSPRRKIRRVGKIAAIYDIPGLYEYRCCYVVSVRNKDKYKKNDVEREMKEE